MQNESDKKAPDGKTLPHFEDNRQDLLAYLSERRVSEAAASAKLHIKPKNTISPHVSLLNASTSSTFSRICLHIDFASLGMTIWDMNCFR